MRTWIEDVVDDSDARGLGAGQALVSASITQAKLVGARSIDLTSGPARATAHRLYEKAGFVARETNVYRYNLE
ncbi:GNAT family N-acetyltransferase [Advenella kashmirensis]